MQIQIKNLASTLVRNLTYEYTPSNPFPSNLGQYNTKSVHAFTKITSHLLHSNETLQQKVRVSNTA